MKNKKLYNIILIIVVVVSIVILLLINNTVFSLTTDKAAELVIKQYLKVIAFGGFVGLVYLYFKRNKKEK